MMMAEGEPAQKPPAKAISVDSLVAVGSLLATGYLITVSPAWGPGRAVSLVLRSTFSKPPKIASAHAKEVASLRWSALYRQPGGRPLSTVVAGPSGVGVSTIVDNAMYGVPGVVYATVEAGMSAEEICHRAYLAVCGHFSEGLLNYRSPRAGKPGVPLAAGRVAWWFERFTGRRPVVVLRLSKRLPTHDLAEIMPACRLLSEFHGLKCVVDGRHGDFRAFGPRGMDATTNKIKPLTPEQAWADPQFKEVAELLDGAGPEARLKDVAWAWLGGYPAKLAWLRDEVLFMQRLKTEEKEQKGGPGLQPSDVALAVETCINREIVIVEDALRWARLDSSRVTKVAGAKMQPGDRELFDRIRVLFKGHDVLPLYKIVDEAGKHPSVPDRLMDVCCDVFYGDHWVWVPEPQAQAQAQTQPQADGTAAASGVPAGQAQPEAKAGRYESALVPVSPAMRLILKHGLTCHELTLEKQRAIALGEGSLVLQRQQRAATVGAADDSQWKRTASTPGEGLQAGHVRGNEGAAGVAPEARMQ